MLAFKAGDWMLLLALGGNPKFCRGNKVKMIVLILKKKCYSRNKGNTFGHYGITFGSSASDLLKSIIPTKAKEKNPGNQGSLP